MSLAAVTLVIIKPAFLAWEQNNLIHVDFYEEIESVFYKNN